ncbi:porin [Xenophilus arseniciresistens]|uniref:Porin n=1 Tax=Xenophilus arseniciresistens TaxID=1283306 RepID=A0AAE3T1I8_9BURK|nr:porin [Xenophilus arseniciresistens]MDA7418625.1 porin [Xenophilus arseniciresistens]
MGITLAAGAALPMAAQAASSVAVYGIVDVAIDHVSSLDAGGASVTRMPGLSGSTPSRLGFRGREDLGNGLNVSFALEMGFGPDTGTLNQGGRGFGRQSWVGLGGRWGTVSLGRQYTLIGTATSAADFVGPATHSIAALDSYFPNARADNSIAWRGKFGGFTVGALYSLGRDAVNAGPSPAGTNCPGEGVTDKRACRAWSAVLRYDDKRWGAAIATDVNRGGPGAFGGLRSDMLDRRVAVSGYAQFDKLRVGLGLVRRDNGASALTPRSDIWTLSGSYAFTPQFTLTAQVLRYDLKASADSARLLILRGNYALSKRTSLYTSVARIDNEGNASFSVSSGQSGANSARGGRQNGLTVGVVHQF